MKCKFSVFKSSTISTSVLCVSFNIFWQENVDSIKITNGQKRKEMKRKRQEKKR